MGIGEPPNAGPQSPPGAHPAPDRPGTTASQVKANPADSRPDRSASMRIAAVLPNHEGDVHPDGEASGASGRGYSNSPAREKGQNDGATCSRTCSLIY